MKKILIIILLLILSACSVKEGTNNSIAIEDSSNNIKEAIIDECTDILFEFPPVNLTKTKVIVPFGLMSGNHVTPVDHQYFQDFDNEKADIEVYSPANGHIRSIQHMAGNNQGSEWDDFRLEIEHLCGISSTYIHIDVLSEKIMQYAPEKGDYKSVNILVNAGEIIGWYSQNVDYNLVDENFILTGFVIPKHYEAEQWKIHVPETYSYFSEPLREKMIEKSLRDKYPYSGKFDHDVDGRLVGNWFKQDTNGYAGFGWERYWKGHLSISPDYLDSDYFIVSIGDYDGKEAQFGTKTNSPNPKNISKESGIIKYELVPYEYYINESRWDRKSLAKGIKVKSGFDVHGVILLELIEDRILKVEIFPGKTAEDVNSFSKDVLIYER